LSFFSSASAFARIARMSRLIRFSTLEIPRLLAVAELFLDRLDPARQ